MKSFSNQMPLRLSKHWASIWVVIRKRVIWLLFTRSIMIRRYHSLDLKQSMNGSSMHTLALMRSVSGIFLLLSLTKQTEVQRKKKKMSELKRFFICLVCKSCVFLLKKTVKFFFSSKNFNLTD